MHRWQVPDMYRCIQRLYLVLVLLVPGSTVFKTSLQNDSLLILATSGDQDGCDSECRLASRTMQWTWNDGKILSIAVAASILLLWAARMERQDKNKTRDPSEDGHDFQEPREKHLTLRRFPWQPSETVPPGQRNVASAILNVSNPNHLSAHEQQTQLSFLASMTFANGGIRSPSCPCCQ